MNSEKTNAMNLAKPAREPFDFARWWDRVGILMVLVALVLLMAIIAPNFNRVDNLLNIARAISINAILAAGMTVVILTGGIDLSVGSTVAVSGVVAVIAPRRKSSAQPSASRKAASSSASTRVASASGSDHTIELRPSASGRNASGPPGWKRCQAVPSWARPVATWATTARWP